MAASTSAAATSKAMSIDKDDLRAPDLPVRMSDRAIRCAAPRKLVTRSHLPTAPPFFRALPSPAVRALRVHVRHMLPDHRGRASLQVPHMHRLRRLLPLPRARRARLPRAQRHSPRARRQLGEQRQAVDHRGRAGPAGCDGLLPRTSRAAAPLPSLPSFDKSAALVPSFLPSFLPSLPPSLPPSLARSLARRTTSRRSRGTSAAPSPRRARTSST